MNLDQKPQEWRVTACSHEYEVSSFGAVRRIDTGRLLKMQVTARGYHRVTIYTDGKPASKSVHGLVAAAFLGPRPPGAHVCHADGDKQHNAVQNLRYASAQENEADKRLHGRQAVGSRNGTHTHPETRTAGERHGGTTLSAAQVVEIKRRLQSYRRGLCKELACKFGIAQSTISGIRGGRYWGSARIDTVLPKEKP